MTPATKPVSLASTAPSTTSEPVSQTPTIPFTTLKPKASKPISEPAPSIILDTRPVAQ